MTKTFASLLLALAAAAAVPARALAAGSCSNPGKDGPASIGGIVNSYFPGVSGVAGVASVTVGAVDTSSGGSAKAIAAGDLLLVIQMQDADLSTSNDSGYGGSSPGSGQIALNNSGAYEYATVAASYLSGSAIPLLAPLQNSYRSQAYSGSNGQRTFQVIRVPQYSALTLSSQLTAAPWNGATGGVVVVDVAGVLSWNGQTVDVTGRGFRGGGGLYLKGRGASQPAYAASDYVSTLAPTVPTFTSNPWTTPGPFTGSNASKGEGIAGTPRYLFVPSPLGAVTNGAGAILDTLVEGYPNGSLARGAPGNAGGGGTDGDPQRAANGGNDQNTGGGGGAGSAAGGQGGFGWTPGTPPGSPTGGFGGQGVPMSAARLALGGGGGAGVTNNGTGTPNFGVASSGAAGGGLVFVRAKTISGSGTVNANGASGNPSVCNDASGGGGGGGAVLIFATGNNGNVGTVAINANGGGGGSNTGSGTGENQSACNPFDNTNPHGPGGGGGGGFAALSSSSNASISVSGGGNGITTPSPTSTAPYGSSSSPGGFQISSVVSSDIPGATPSPLCFPLLTVTKVTTWANTVQGGTTSYTITVANSASYGTATSVVLGDALPSGLNLASTDAVTTSAGASRTSVGNPAVGATSPSWGAFSIPGGGAVSVSFTVNVPAATPVGVLQNPASVTYDDPTRTAAGQTVTPGGTYSTGDFVQGSNYNPLSSTAEDVNVRQPAVLTVAFSPVSVNAGGTTQLIVSVQNPNGVALPASAFTDALPPGLTATGGAVTVTGCSGFTPTTVAAGASAFAQSGGTVPANATCTFSISVTAASAQSYLDTIPAAAFTNSLNVSNVAPASGTLLSRPTLAKSFSPSAVAAGASATLTFILVNPNASTPLTNASFADTFPSPMQVVGSAVTVSGACTGFPANIAAGTTAFNPSGVALPAGATCTISFQVKSATAGPYTNTASGVTTAETVAAGAPSNSAQLGVGVVGIAKSFGASRIQSGGTTVVTLSLTNPSGVAQTNGSFGDVLSGMSAGATAVGGTCTGTTPSSLTVGQTNLSFTGINIPAAGCTVTFTVTSASAGTQTNTASGVTTSLLPAGPPSNTATLVVTAPPSIATSFAPSTIQIGATSLVTFTLVNGDSIPLTGASFSDTLTNLQVAAAGTAGGTCAGAASNSFVLNQTGALNFSGLTVPPGAGGCTVTIPVTATTVSPAAGYPNSTSGLSSVEAATGPVSNTARLIVAAPATIAKAFATSPIGQGGTSLLTFTLANSSNVPLTGSSFTDTLANMSISGAGAAGGSCAGASSNNFAAGQTGTLNFSGLTIPLTGNCTVTVTVTSSNSGINSNTASGVTSNETPVAGPASNTANLVVDSPPQLSVGFFPGVILTSAASPASKSTLTITLANSNAAALTSVAFTDALTGMQIFATGAAGGTCPGAAGNSFTAGATSLSFSGLTIPASGSCTVTVQVSSPSVSPASGWPNATSGATSTQTPAAGPASPAGYLTVVSYATVQKVFSPSSTAAAGTSTIIFTLSNPNAIDLSAARFSDTFPTAPGAMTTSGVAQNYIGGGRGTCTGAIPSAGSTTVASVSFTGLVIPANSSCTVMVDVTANVPGNYSNTASGLTTAQTGASPGPASNTATLGVATLGIAKSFSPPSIGVGEKSSLSVVVSNPTGVAVPGLVVTDSFPAGMSIASPLNVTDGCGGTLRNAANTANSAAGDTGFSLQGGILAANSTCTITADVITSGAGSYPNTTSAPSSGGVGVGPPSNTATLTVVQKPAISEAFAPPLVDTFKNSLLTFTVTNPNAAGLTSCNFTDALAGFAVGSPPSIGGTCAGVTSTPALATSATSLNLTIPSLNNGSCTISVPVTSGTAGTYSNAASGVMCSQTVSAGSAPASAQVTFNKLPISLVKSASQLTVPPGSAVTYTITYGNPNSAQGLQNIVISDATPVFTAFSSAACGALPASLTSCTISAPAVGATGTVTWTLGGSLDPGATGSVSLTVTVK